MKKISSYIRCDGKQHLSHYDNGTVQLEDSTGETLAIYPANDNSSLLQMMHTIIRQHLSSGLDLYRWELSSLESSKLTHNGKYTIVEYNCMRNGYYSIAYVLEHDRPIIFQALDAAEKWIGNHAGIYYVLDY